MTTVYVVTSGDYDNYSIDGIFSTRKQAEDFITPLNRICGWHPLLSYPNSMPDESYSIEEHTLDTLSTLLKEEDITYYWECEVTTKTDYCGRKEGNYSVKRKAIAKQDVEKLLLYKEENTCFYCSSPFSEQEVVERAHAYYQKHLKESGK
jgi:hypothetical protein